MSSDLRQHLEAELHALRDRHARVAAHLRNADRDLPVDFADRATETENDAVLEVLDEAGRARIQSLEDALARMDRGALGVCVVCGGEIDPRRRVALPEATTCTRCGGR